jgi:FeS assembly SUF system regulator
MADYAVVLMTHLHQAGGGRMTTKDLVKKSHLPEPTVAKLMKQLAADDLVTSTRGAHGGFSLNQSAEEISILSVIESIDGPFAITDCQSTEDGVHCRMENFCVTRPNWSAVNDVIRNTLNGMSLAAMGVENNPSAPISFIKDDGLKQAAQ